MARNQITLSKGWAEYLEKVVDDQYDMGAKIRKFKLFGTWLTGWVSAEANQVWNWVEVTTCTPDGKYVLVRMGPSGLRKHPDYPDQEADNE